MIYKVIGWVWFLQGIKVIPGSLLIGQVQMAISGALAAGYRRL